MRSREAAAPHLGEDERNKLLYAWNPAPTPYPESTVQALFEKQAGEHGESVALIFNKSCLAYRELNEQANRLAHYLITAGVQPGQGVATFLDRGFDQIIATLAILKAGAAYIPLDAEFPPERIAQMLEDAEPHCILSHSSVAERLAKVGTATLLILDELGEELQSHPGSNPSVECRADFLAYIMYTSGSTGRPKGVEVVHRGIVRLLFGVDYVPLNTDTTILHMAAASFDASTFEIWGALLHGGTCVLCPSRVPTLDTIGLLLAKHRVNTFWMTASLFNLVISEAPQILKPVKYLLAGGEALSPWHVEKALRELPETLLINGYGPTENTTFSTTYAFNRALFDPDLPIPIGRAIGNSTCYILDASLSPVPVGVPGELYVGGDGLARGYANRPDLTGERFLVDPFSAKQGARMYKTGDMVCWNQDGLIEFIGRVDNQVKLRGFRIELQEIDIALGSYPGVEQAVTVVYEDNVHGKWLAAYVKVTDPKQFPVDGLEAYARGKLPDYMVPAALVPVTEWSFTPSGKLDRKALPTPQFSAPSGVGFQAPGNDTQKTLAGIWEHLLQIERVGIDDSFFDLGGDSLRAVHLFHEIHQKLGCELPLSTLALAPTVRGLAAIVDGSSADLQLEGFRSLQLIQKGDPGVAPLFLIHGGAGNVVVFREFARNLGTQQPVYAFQWSGWDGDRGHRTIPEMATAYKEELLRFCPLDAYRLGGHCIGGLIAIELAHQLRMDGIGVDGPIFVSDCPNLESKKYRRVEPETSVLSRKAFNGMVEELKSRKTVDCGEWDIPPLAKPSLGLSATLKRVPAVVGAIRRVRAFPQVATVNLMLARGQKVPMDQRAFYSATTLVAAAKRHASPRYPGDMVYFRSACVLGRNLGLAGWWDDPFLGFGELCDGRFEGHVVGGGHNEVLNLPQVAEVARRAWFDG
ncbi:MAG: amino acid adenylation domain-containing protein [Verrucomicrobiota bacterium]